MMRCCFRRKEIVTVTHLKQLMAIVIVLLLLQRLFSVCSQDLVDT